MNSPTVSIATHGPILAAQAQLAAETGAGLEVIVATTNPGHLGRFATALLWDQVAP